MVIYLDQYMVLNALFDGLVLYAGGIGMQKKGFLWRLLLCAVTGSLLGTLLTWIDRGGRSPWWAMSQTALLLLAYAIVYRQFHIRELVQGFVKMFFGACLLAGLLFAWKERAELHFVPMVLAGLSIQLFLPLLDALWLYYQNRHLLCDVSVSFRGEKISGTGLWDTGNRLVEPVSKKPVLIAQKERFLSVFSGQEWEQIQEYAQSGCFKPELMPCLLYRIPYQAVGGSGYLAAVKAERVEITGAGKKQRGEHVLIALYDGALSATNDYQFILQDITC